MSRIFLFLLPLALIPAGCKTGGSTAREPLVTVSILPQKYFVDRMTAGTVAVNVLIPPGASPATYEPTPRQMQDLSRSALFLMVGHLGFENAWGKRIRDNNPDLPVYSLSDSIDLIREGHHGVDPHIWMSPRTVKRFLPTLYQALVNTFPEQAEAFTPHYQRLLARVDSLDHLMEESFRDLPSRKFLIFHPALSYLARDYGLEQLSLEEEGKEPSVQGLQKLVDLAREEGIRVVFIQDEFDQENARTLASEIGGEVVRISPLSPDWEQGMEQIRQALVRALHQQEARL